MKKIILMLFLVLFYIGCLDEGKNNIFILPNSINNIPVIEVIDPCGDNPNEFDEVILKLSDNSIFCYFKDGENEFLTELVPGNYVTTDSQKCHFIIDENYNVGW